MTRSLLALLALALPAAADTITVPGTATVLTVPAGCVLAGTVVTCPGAPPPPLQCPSPPGPGPCAPPPPPPPPAWNGTCAGFSETKVIDAKVPANGVNVRYYTNVAGTFRNGAASGFGATEALVVVFKAPPLDPYFSIGMYETGAPVTGSPSYRTMTVGSVPCDWHFPASTDALWAAEDTRMSLNFSAGGTSPYARYNLTPGATYYVNVSNSAFGAQQCAGGRCDVFFSFSNPKP